MFVDRAKLTIKSGKGGDGSVSFRREPFVPQGGPDGGDGGKGGDIIFLADRNLKTLLDFRYKRKYEADNGEDGKNKKCFGKNGSDCIIKVPVGTIIIDEETNLPMKDLKEDGDTLIALKGGKGGKGNVHFKSSVRQAPKFAEAGESAREKQIILELKLIADVGLIGFPNVGKSTLLSVVTGAKPKIANYHFTTIHPNLGVVRYYDKRFVMADIPGLIEGAHKGIGLGLDFLKHIERTKLLIHIVDVSGSEGRDPIDDFNKINHELSSYGNMLSFKPQIVVANKIDLITETDKGQYERFEEYVNKKGYSVYPISAYTNKGVDELISATYKALEALPEEKETAIEYYSPETGKGATYREIKCSKEGSIFILSGEQLEKIFKSTNVNDIGSLRYFYKYIEEEGAIERLKEMGMKNGSTIRILDFEFEYFGDE